MLRVPKFLPRLARQAGVVPSHMSGASSMFRVSTIPPPRPNDYYIKCGMPMMRSHVLREDSTAEPLFVFTESARC